MSRIATACAVASPEPPAGETERLALSCLLMRLGDKWTVSVLLILGAGPLRYSAIKRGVEGVSQRMLTVTLRVLERDGMVTRTVTPTVPPRVDYELTPLGRSLQAQVCDLARCAARNQGAVRAAQHDFDARQD